MESKETSERFESRKQDHIQIALRSENQAQGFSGLDSIVLEHDALPELNFDKVSIESTYFNKKLKTPLFISSMTAGHQSALEINSTLAKACEERGWMMGVGSQRRELFDRSAETEWKAIRRFAPHVVLMGNLGLSQLIQIKTADVERLTETLEASAMFIHLNALQEVIQPEGTPQFYRGLEALENLCKTLSVPVIVKETGCGFSQKTLKKLLNVGVYAVDISGFGGTHWGRIEGQRSPEQSLQNEVAQTFKNWGVSTVQSMLNALELKPSYKIWASGGVRTGLDAAKLLAMGAEAVGFAKPALEEALKGQEKLWNWMEKREYELRVSLFCTGSANLEQLKITNWKKI